MADPARRRATYDDLRDVPAHIVGEILNGDLVTSPRLLGDFGAKGQ